MTRLTDDLGEPLVLDTAPRRVVSLVPSLTEAIAMTCPGALVGATDYCTHPAGLDVERVRGTKNPNVARIVELRPDLVIANQEENRALDVRRLRDAGIPVWVTVIDTIDEALTSLERLLCGVFRALVPAWLTDARDVWASPARLPGARIAVPIWRDPWIWVGHSTYAADVLARLGLINAVDQPRYPGIAPKDLGSVDSFVLPDEPYHFTGDDAASLPAAPAVLVDGRALFWYGPAMVSARAELESALAGERGVQGA